MRFFKKAVNNHCFEGNPCSLFARLSWIGVLTLGRQCGEVWIGTPHTGAPVWGGLRLPQAPPASKVWFLKFFRICSHWGPSVRTPLGNPNFRTKLPEVLISVHWGPSVRSPESGGAFGSLRPPHTGAPVRGAPIQEGRANKLHGFPSKQ